MSKHWTGFGKPSFEMSMTEQVMSMKRRLLSIAASEKLSKYWPKFLVPQKTYVH